GCKAKSGRWKDSTDADLSPLAGSLQLDLGPMCRRKEKPRQDRGRGTVVSCLLKAESVAPARPGAGVASLNGSDAGSARLRQQGLAFPAVEIRLVDGATDDQDNHEYRPGGKHLTRLDGALSGFVGHRLIQAMHSL